MNKVKYLIICLMFFITTGCYSYKEIHEISFVISFGFDYIENEQMYEVTAYIINNANLTLAENQTSSEHNAYIGTAKGKTISNAIEELNKNLDIILEFKHIKTVFITTNFINSDNLKYLYTFFLNISHVIHVFFLIRLSTQSTNSRAFRRIQHLHLDISSIRNLTHNAAQSINFTN